MDKRRSKIDSNKWQSKTQFISIFDRHLSIVKSVFDCPLPGVLKFVASSCMVMERGYKWHTEHLAHMKE